MFLQQCSQPCLQAEQLSSKIVGRTTARWPTLRPLTPSPTASIIPLNSWPIVMGDFSPVIGCFFSGMRTGPEVYSWRSVSTLNSYRKIGRLRVNMFLTTTADSHEGWFHLRSNRQTRCSILKILHRQFNTFTSPLPHWGSSRCSTRISPGPWNRTAVAVIVLAYNVVASCRC